MSPAWPGGITFFDSADMYSRGASEVVLGRLVRKLLAMDYVDLYQIHRWDPETPIEETMEALHDVVKDGKARQFAKAQRVAEAHSPVPRVSSRGTGRAAGFDPTTCGWKWSTLASLGRAATV